MSTFFVFANAFVINNLPEARRKTLRHYGVHYSNEFIARDVFAPFFLGQACWSRSFLTR